jgi:serine/threonine protein kinase
VLITTRGDVKLCDVGVSRKQVSVTTSAYHAPSMMTMTMAVGTWPYMPPEIMQDDEARGGGDRSRYDGRASDVYSMAMTFIQMWTCAALYPPEIGAVQVRVSC